MWPWAGKRNETLWHKTVLRGLPLYGQLILGAPISLLHVVLTLYDSEGSLYMINFTNFLMARQIYWQVVGSAGTSLQVCL